jgi:threonylcarbamoyladenosine tRNA methylthiotransferase MtaB
MSLLEESGYMTRPREEGRSVYHDARTRSFLKVQDGCRNFCSYCVVPLVRSRQHSVPVASVIEEARNREDDGYQELVLTGTEIGAYDDNGVGIAELVQRLLAQTAIARLRLSSLQPQEISRDFLRLWRDSRLCQHFHLSLQSGSESVLGRMKRRYSTSEYLRAVKMIRAVLPEAAITTDVIVGFPGETDDEFRESLELCRDVGFARVHVFPFSPRPGTGASTMLGRIPEEVKKRRSREMLTLADESSLAFICSFSGRIMTVLWEKQSGGLWSGFTDNYIKVFARSSGDLTGKLLPVQLVKTYRDGIWGLISP